MGGIIKKARQNEPNSDLSGHKVVTQESPFKETEYSRQNKIENDKRASFLDTNSNSTKQMLSELDNI